MSRLEAAAICTPGLESLCAAELVALGIRAKTVGAGVVEFKPTTRQFYAANLWLRTASRVLVRIAKFRATDFNYLETRAGEVDWDRWLPEGYRPTFRITSKKSKLFHTDAISERLQKFLSPGPGREVGRNSPEQPFVIRIDNDVFSVSVDASGQSLHQRGWRTESGIAPLRPTMAAALLLASGWDADSPLADPFCGSGTIAIEAALMAMKLPPGGDRDFAFAHWPEFEPGTWASVAGSVGPNVRTDLPFAIEASDRDGSAVEITRANAERAGVSEQLQIEERVVSHITGDSGLGLVATNPPFGKRVGDGDLTALYKRTGATLRDRRPQWGLAVVAADSKLVRAIDSRLKPIGGYGHGGLKVQMFSREGSAPTESTPPETPASAPPAATT